MRVILYEDNDRLRYSLELLISGAHGIEFVGAFSNTEYVERHILEFQPDVVIMDINMPDFDGISGVKRIKECAPNVLIIMHTVFEDDNKIFTSLAAGANGYLLKNIEPSELIAAIKDVYTGGSPLSPSIARKVLFSFYQKRTDSVNQEKHELSEREVEILQFLVKGFTYKHIAQECFISIETVRSHIKNIYAKLHVNCGTEAVAKALRLGISK